MQTWVQKKQCKLKRGYWTKKESEALTERNLCSTSDAVIEDNNLPDVQTIQEKEKQDRDIPLEFQKIQIESFTTTAINLGRAMECLSYQILLSESNVLNHAKHHYGITDERIRRISKHMVIDLNSLFTSASNLKKADTKAIKGLAMIFSKEYGPIFFHLESV